MIQTIKNKFEEEKQTLKKEFEQEKQTLKKETEETIKILTQRLKQKFDEVVFKNENLQPPRGKVWKEMYYKNKKVLVSCFSKEIPNLESKVGRDVFVQIEDRDLIVNKNGMRIEI
jgi:hypothetical protein